MRVTGWNNKVFGEYENVTYDRLLKAAGVLKAAVRRRCPTGTITRPMYTSGKYAGQKWTSRDAGRLRRSVRIVGKKEEFGRELFHGALRETNVRVYAGHYMAWYADIVEHDKPFMRPAWKESLPMIKSILGVR